MTSPAVPSGLEALLAKATPGPWEANTDGSFYAAELRSPSPHNGFALIKVMTNADADLALIALAPDAVRLLVDMAAELGRDGFVGSRADVEARCRNIQELLARFAALDQRAGTA
jgi:hypothetical protein